MMEDDRRPLSNSEMGTLLRCKRKWWLAYYRGLTPAAYEVTGPRQLGTRIHYALEVYYTPDAEGKLNPSRAEAALEETIKQDLDAFPEAKDDVEKEADLARAMLTGYFEWLAETGADEGLVVLAQERKVRVAGPDGYPLIAKLDLQVQRSSDNARLFLDHKTVGDLTSPVKTLAIDQQMLFYHLLDFLEALQAGTSERVDGALYNMLRKVKRTARANPPFYGRVEVRHNDAELRSMWKRVSYAVRQIAELTAALDAGGDPNFVVPPTPHSNCSWDCDFFPVCPMFDDGSHAEALIEAHYNVRDPLARYNDPPKGDG
jgi:hypothetical protein